uniref:Uncharacterized protein n=1 Tax=Oryza sativa subsp. japonica TaxID=39947 RepID=Q69LY9_ORYSJ|nr:hypothetical protein [Oryza sativa Japonica Group]BAD36387.1 hypothetical protein [Oryza sativa Japonica Group]
MDSKNMSSRLLCEQRNKYWQPSNAGIFVASHHSGRRQWFLWSNGADQGFGAIGECLKFERHRARVYAIKLWGAAAFAPLGSQCRCLWSTPPLVVAVLRGALLSISTSPVDFLPLHRHGAVAVLSSRTVASPLSSSSSPFAHRQPRRPHWSSSAAQGLLHRLRASPPHLQAATVATLGRWSSYLYMATDIAVQAIGPATSPSTSSNMIHRQRRRIFLDYTSLFSSNCVLLRQFSLYAVLAPRPSRRPSLLVSSDISLPDFGYIDHGYCTHGYLDHGSLATFALAMSTMAQRVIIRIEHSCRFLLYSKCPHCSRLDCGGMLEYMPPEAQYSGPIFAVSSLPILSNNMHLRGTE